MPGALRAQYQMAVNHTGNTMQSGRGELATVLLDFAESRQLELAYQPELLVNQKSDCEPLCTQAKRVYCTPAPEWRVCDSKA